MVYKARYETFPSLISAVTPTEYQLEKWARVPCVQEEWPPPTPTWCILCEASFMMDQTLFEQKGNFLVPFSSRWLLIWSLSWKKQLNNPQIFKIWCSWKIRDRAAWSVWRKYPLTHYNLRTHEMNWLTFISCLLINTGFRVIKHYFWIKFFSHKMFITNSTSITIPLIQ